MYITKYYAKHCNRSRVSRLSFYLPHPNSEQNHVWMFSAAVIMSRLEKKSIKAHLNQDIKPPFAVLRLPKSSSDLCPQMVMWQMIFPEDIQNTEAHSAPTQETAVWKQLWGPFCEVQAAPTHTNGGVEREKPRKSKGLLEKSFP